MALWRGMGARKDATRGTSPIEVRKAMAALFSSPGVLPGGASPLMTGDATWAYNIGIANFVTSRGASDGDQLYGNDGVALIGATGVGSTVPIAPGAGLSRIDIAWTRHPTNTENADTSSEPLFGVESGVAASSNPVAPSIPAGALELGRNLMTSAATSTSSVGNTITQSAPVASLRAAQAAAFATDVANLAAHMVATVVHGATGAVVGTTNAQTLTNKTLTAPVIADLTNANHIHKNAVTGGVVPFAASGSFTATPSGVGNVAVVYGVTFATAVSCIANTADGASVVVTCISGGTTGATVRLFDGATGAALTAGLRQINWIAIGTLA